ncbi:MAG: hypothetical protein CM1200mP14_28720 [Gammaproteobacteria bacterium]|nr:MAG: hypothetical protein CM1200mP14_28720 [Gammaproteobacteria bacterium]
MILPSPSSDFHHHGTILKGGIEVESRGRRTTTNSEDQPFFVTVLQDGTIFMEETEVTLEELEAGFLNLWLQGTFSAFISG